MMSLRPLCLLVALLAAVPAGAAAPAAANVDHAQRSLLNEHNDALRADNRELRSRIADLEAQRQDAARLIALKAARLQALEKDHGKH